MRILVTVGAQLPFERLISSINRINVAKKYEIFAQIGEDKSEYSNIETVNFLTAKEYSDKLLWCDMVLAHAGMGTIIQCMELNKKLIVVPRLAKFGEHRNDHQLDTVSQFEGMVSEQSLLQICRDPELLHVHLANLAKLEQHNYFLCNNDPNSSPLGQFVKNLIDNEI